MLLAGNILAYPASPMKLCEGQIKFMRSCLVADNWPSLPIAGSVLGFPSLPVGCMVGPWGPQGARADHAATDL
jgi:hypothetical protein